MTGKHVSLAFAFVAVLLMPSRAAAEGGLWEFLEKLSGPGPFHGIMLDFRSRVESSPTPVQAGHRAFSACTRSCSRLPCAAERA